MTRNYLAVLLLIPLAAGCTPRGSALLSDEPGLNAFVREAARSLEAHDWQQILAIADRNHYRTQVVEHGMGEPQYVAELFGLHRADNDLKRGEAVRWSDLERIASVELQSVTSQGEQHLLTGIVTLEGGHTLALQARVERVQDRFVLTGAVG